MDDRELLELAAKAAGYRIHGWIGEKLYVINDLNPACYRDPFWWCPLYDDAQAFRLAVALDISLRQRLGMVMAEFPFVDEEFNTRKVICAAVLDDYCASSRRAIVSAAAEIGKQMDAPLVRDGEG